MKQGKYAYRLQADALDAYWNSQNRKIKSIETFIAQGGSLTPELNRQIASVQESGMNAYEAMMQGQSALLAYLTQTPSVPMVTATKENGNPWANAVIDAIDLNDPETIKRREVQITRCEKPVPGKSAMPESGVILMMGAEDAYGTMLKRYMLDRGLSVRQLPCFMSEDEAEAQIAAAASEGEITGLVVLGNQYYGEADRDRYYDYILTIATVIKRYVIYIRAQKTDTQRLFLFNTFMDGQLGMTGQSEYYHYGTLNGMAKCIEIELRGLVYSKTVDFEPTLPIETMLNDLKEELCYHDHLQEVGRMADGGRYRLTSVLTKSVVTENRFPLGEDDVLLVSGGSRGVTSSCILELVKRVKCTFVLLGRAKILDEYNDDEETANITELKDMKTLIARRFKAQGHKGGLTAIEKKARAILSQRELFATMETIKATGNRVYYYSCDVNDRDGMKTVMAKIQQEVGKITGVVHGAGIVSDSKIWNKDMKSFARVFGTKYHGLNNIMDNVDKTTLKALVMFSSLSGYFGNDGQIDYVAGNEYMDKYAYYIRKKYPNCRALAINWGAWNGGMMYIDALYISTLKEKGYILIPLEVGANYFVNDFLMGLPSTQILINNTGNPPV